MEDELTQAATESFGLLAAIAYQQRILRDNPNIDRDFLLECAARHGAMQGAKLAHVLQARRKPAIVAAPAF